MPGISDMYHSRTLFCHPLIFSHPLVLSPGRTVMLKTNLCPTRSRDNASPLPCISPLAIILFPFRPLLLALSPSSFPLPSPSLPSLPPYPSPAPPGLLPATPGPKFATQRHRHQIRKNKKSFPDHPSRHIQSSAIAVPALRFRANRQDRVFSSPIGDLPELSDNIIYLSDSN